MFVASISVCVREVISLHVERFEGIFTKHGIKPYAIERNTNAVLLNIQHL
jgi:hypothetical protein